MTQPARSSTKAAIWLAAFILALAAFLVTYVPKLREAQSLRVEKYKLDEQLREQEAEYNRLLARRQALTNDPREVERVTREAESGQAGRDCISLRIRKFSAAG